MGQIVLDRDVLEITIAKALQEAINMGKVI